MGHSMSDQSFLEREELTPSVSVRPKLLMIFATLCVFMLALTLVVWISLDRIQSTVERFNSVTSVNISSALHIARDINEIASYTLRPDRKKNEDNISTADWTTLLSKVDSLADRIKILPLSKESLVNADRSVGGMRRGLQQLIEQQTNLIRPSGNAEGGEFLLFSIEKARQKEKLLRVGVEQSAIALWTTVIKYIEIAQHSSIREHDRVLLDAAASKSIVIVITVVLLVAAIAGILVVKELTTDLVSVTNAVNSLAQGNKYQSSIEIKRDDEIGELSRAFNVFRANAIALDKLTQDLKQQSRLQETIFENINDGLSVFDERGKLVKWNQQYKKIFPSLPTNIRYGMTLVEVRDLLAIEQHENRSLDGRVLDIDDINEQRMRAPKRFVRYYSSGKVIEFRSSPMPQGGFVTLYTDLTEVKALESQFYQSQKMETIGQLVGGLAHDFNNLLTAIIGNLEFLEALLAESPDKQEPIFRALAAADRGASLTQRLLSFACKQRLNPETVNLNTILEGMLDLVEYSSNPNITLQLELDSDPWLISIDPAQLENTILNLSLNSSAAMPDGGCLTFSTRKETRENGEKLPSESVVLEVSDTGRGISDAVIKRIFEPFFTTKEKATSSGLGLSMVYGFIKQSGGDISVSSTAGECTTFSIVLPRFTPSSDRTEETFMTMADKKHFLEESRVAKASIIVVEDDMQVQDIIRQILNATGCDFEIVGSAEAAVELISDDVSWDLVVSDINFPGEMSGIDLEYRINTHHPNLKMLLMSAIPRSQLEERVDFDNAESKDILAKPFRKGEFLDAISQRLEQQY